MKTVKVRNIEIGEGIPKICVPIVQTSLPEILKEASSFHSIPCDVVEWRIDWFEGVNDSKAVLTALKELRNTLKEIPLLVTCRTSTEGGNIKISDEDYKALNQSVIESGYADLIDVQIFTNIEIVKALIAAAHEHNVYVIASNHDFEKTPDKDHILNVLKYMQTMNADISKIAVMPRSKRDVLTLLTATEEMYTTYAVGPIITMSMSADGVISRLCGEIFGSALTFGAASKASAPGQIGVNDLEKVLQIIHKFI